MIVATFRDGSTRYFGTINGLGPKPHGAYLFEFPDGELREGTLRVLTGLEACGKDRPRTNAQFDALTHKVVVKI
jgi:hypothetical protein